MKKIPTLFVRRFENGKTLGATEVVTPGLEWVLEGKGQATIKIDGSCCAIREGAFYQRYNAKKGKVPQCKIKRSDFGFSWPVKEA